MTTVRRSSNRPYGGKKKRVKHRRLRPEGVRNLTIFCLAAAIFIGLLLLPFVELKTISYSGLSYYSDEQMDRYLYPTEGSRKAIGSFLREVFLPHKEIPFVIKYTVKYDTWRDVTITVYEKALAGCVRFQDSYIYFDDEGYVVENAVEPLHRVYEITGLNLAYAVLGQKLPIADETQLASVLTTRQFVQAQEIEWGGGRTLLGSLLQRMHFNSGGMSLIFGNITVQLGTNEHLEEKLSLMSDILPKLYGRQGTLLLDTYKEGQTGSSYVFRDKAADTAAQTGS